jgi:hypothetical protein
MLRLLVLFALKKPPVINQVFKEIFNGNETRDEKINKLINYVQDDIRYMGMESGIGSIKPFPPEQVIKQRFGDCKDKSLLLVSLLKQIGIEQAYPALVNTYLRNETNKQFPSGEIFNHCIVNFIVDSVNYWVDPTITQQGGNYKNISIAEYGKALIIGLTSDSLSTMKPASNISSCEILDEYFITSFNAPAQLRMTSKRYGFEADMRRFMFEQYSADTYANYVTSSVATGAAASSSAGGGVFLARIAFAFASLTADSAANRFFISSCLLACTLLAFPLIFDSFSANHLSNLASANS